MDCPLSEAHFVETEASTRADALMNDENAPVIVLHSERSGVGKSAIALEVCSNISTVKFRHEKNKVMFHLFNCTNFDTLCNDLRLFYETVDRLNHQQLSYHSPSKWNIIQHLFRDMNEHFPEKFKLFIFDSADKHFEDILKVFNEIRKGMTETENRLWKILVTLQAKKLQPRVYSFIREEHFIRVEGFNLDQTKALYRSSNLRDETVEKIRQQLGPTVLLLKICLKMLTSNQIDDLATYVDNLLENIEKEAKVLIRGEKQPDPSDSPLIAIKVYIDRALEDLRFREDSLSIIKTISLFDSDNISGELLIACAECYNPDPVAAEMIVKSLTSRLVGRGIWTQRRENKDPFFSLYELVKQSMELFIRDDQEREHLIKQALKALTRVMPKDGRKHQSRFVGFYLAHGKSLDCAVKKLRGVNRIDTPFIQLLHCNLHVALAYCQAVLKDKDGEKARLKEAMDKYCELVLDASYDDIRHGLRGSHVPLSEKEAAKELYDKGRYIDLLADQEYKQYAIEMPQYLHLTDKDLTKMACNIKADKLVNQHLGLAELDYLRSEDMIITDGGQLASVFLAEVLLQIIWKCTKAYRGDAEGNVQVRISKLEAGLEVCQEIFADHKKCLLIAVMIERELLREKLKLAQTPADVTGICTKFESLSNIGEGSERRYAFEAGLMRSDMAVDFYNKLLCKESVIECKGKLYGFADNDTEKRRLYDEGKQLFEEVKRIAKKEVHGHVTLCFSYRNFARFLSSCEQYGDAVLCIITAMRELHLHFDPNETYESHQELDDHRFTELYDKLFERYNTFCTHRGVRTDDNQLLAPVMPECKYLQAAMQFWGNKTSPDHQPTDSDTKFGFLEDLVTNETKEV